MASISTENGTRKVQFFKRTPNGDIRAAKRFTANEIKAGKHLDWQRQLLQQRAPTSDASLHALFTRYVLEVSKHKRGRRAFKKEGDYFARLVAKDVGFFKTDRAIASVSESDIEKYVAQRLREVAVGTARRDFNTLRDFFRQCASKKVGNKGCWKIIERNPCENVTLPQAKSPKGIYVTVAMRAEYHAAAKTTEEQLMLDVYDFAIETGLRRGEIAGIASENIAAKVVTLFDGTTKNGEGRDIPLTPRAREILKQYPQGFGITDPDWITRTHKRLVKRVVKAGGIKYKFHHCRHTAATDHGNSGKFSAFELMAWFGWADIETAQIYVKTHVESMADRFAPTPPRKAPNLRLAA